MLVWIFWIEVTLRLMAFGKFFLADPFNVIDFLVVWASWILEIGFDDVVSASQSNGIVALRMIRLIRALSTVDRFKILITTSVSVIKNFCILFALEFCVFYVFAVVGMMVSFVIFLDFCF